MMENKKKLDEQLHYKASFKLNNYGIIEGYIYSLEHHEIPVSVEIYCDGAFIGLSRADNEKPLSDTNEPFHGLHFEIPDIFFSISRTYSIQVANTKFIFPVNFQYLLTSPDHKFSRSILHKSKIIYNGGGIIRGLIKTSAFPADDYLNVFCDDDHLYRVEITDRIPWTSSVEEIKGFKIELPDHLYDGKSHILSIHDHHGNEIYGSPVEILLDRRDLLAFIQEETCDPTKNNKKDTQSFYRILKSFEDRYPRSVGFSLYESWRVLRRKHLKIGHYYPDKITVILINSGKYSPKKEYYYQSQKEYFRQLGVRIKKSDEKNIVKNLFLAAQQSNFVFPVWDLDQITIEEIHEFIYQMKISHAEIAYCDVDFIGSGKKRTDPWFKPAWDETMFLSLDYLSRGLCLTGKAIETISNYAIKQGKSSPSSWDEFLFKTIALYRNKIIHIPQILYSSSQKHQQFMRGRTRLRINALANYIKTEYKINSSTIIPDNNGLLHIRWPVPAKQPKVSIIIPTRDSLALLKKCIESLEQITNYNNYELVIINNQSSDASVIQYFCDIEERGVKIINYDKPFNYSDMHNIALSIITSPIVCFMNNDICIIEPSWLTEMVSHLLRKSVGAVGAKLVWPNSIVQHAGVIVGIDGLAAHIGNYLSIDDPGYFWCNSTVRELSAVTAACMVVRRSDFLSLGGFNANLFPVSFNDVDFCLRLRQRGQKIVWTPLAILSHLESASRGKDISVAQRARSHQEERAFRTKWTASNFLDPFYNPNLSSDYLTGPYGGLSLNSSRQKPRLNRI